MLSVDTNIVIWGIKRQATSNRQHMIAKAIAFFEACQRDGTPIMLPAHALAEYLVDFDDAGRHASLAVMEKAFFIAPFDARAAVVASRLKQRKEAVAGVMRQFGVTRQTVTSDIAIIATSAAAGASRLISEDAQVLELAKGVIVAERLPEIPPAVEDA